MVCFSDFRRRTKPYDLRDSIVAMDLDKFDTDKLIALRGIAPSDEDLPTLKGYDGDLKKIDEVRFVQVAASPSLSCVSGRMTWLQKAGDPPPVKSPYPLSLQL